MGLNEGSPDGATPLELEELEQLIPDQITTRAELDEWEQANILRAERWVFGRSRGKPALPSDEYVRLLHKKMFDKTWRWAGQYRSSDKNLGIDWHYIVEEVAKLCDDTRYWIQQESYDLDECAARFHHRMVAIHPFANGNGRHSRLLADAILVASARLRFSWGASNLGAPGRARVRYLSALRSADRGELGELLAFVRS